MNTNRHLAELYLLIVFITASFVVVPIQMVYGMDYYSYGKIGVIGLVTISLVVYDGMKSIKRVNRINKIQFSYVNLFIMLLLLLAAISTVIHRDPLSVWGVPYAPEGFVILGINILVLWMSRRIMNPKLLSSYTMDALLVIGCLVAFYSIGEFFAWWPKITELFRMGTEYQGNMTTIGNRNFLGSYMTILVAIAMAWILFYGKKRGYIYVSILTCGLLISQTRSAYVAYAGMLFVSLFLVIPDRKQRIRFFILILYLGIFIMGGLYLLTNMFKDPRIVARLTLLWQDIWHLSGDSAGSDRVLIWKNAIQLIGDYPLFGYGPDHFGYAYKEVIGPFKYMYQKAHNEWLHMLITLGAPYLGVYIVLLSIALHRVWAKREYRAYRLIGLVLIGYTIQSMFNISVVGMNTIYYIFLGMALYDKDIPFQTE